MGVRKKEIELYKSVKRFVLARIYTRSGYTRSGYARWSYHKI